MQHTVVKPHQYTAEQDNPFSHLAVSAVSDSLQDAVGPSGCQSSTCNQCVFILQLIWILRFCSAELISSFSSPILYIYLGLPCPRWRICHLLLLKFVQLVIIQPTVSSRSLFLYRKEMYASWQKTLVQVLPVFFPTLHSFFICFKFLLHSFVLKSKHRDFSF